MNFHLFQLKQFHYSFWFIMTQKIDCFSFVFSNQYNRTKKKNNLFHIFTRKKSFHEIDSSGTKYFTSRQHWTSTLLKTKSNSILLDFQHGRRTVVHLLSMYMCIHVQFIEWYQLSLFYRFSFSTQKNIFIYLPFWFVLMLSGEKYFSQCTCVCTLKYPCDIDQCVWMRVRKFSIAQNQFHVVFSFLY